MKLRPYHPDDCPALAALFYDTVHTVNCRDYSAEQNGQIVGFGDISRDGYLDRLYVHARFQRQGATAG